MGCRPVAVVLPGFPSTVGQRWGLKVTTHLHLVPRLRMHGALPPLLCSFKACTGKSLP